MNTKLVGIIVGMSWEARFIITSQSVGAPPSGSTSQRQATPLHARFRRNVRDGGAWSVGADGQKTDGSRKALESAGVDLIVTASVTAHRSRSSAGQYLGATPAHRRCNRTAYSSEKSILRWTSRNPLHHGARILFRAAAQTDSRMMADVITVSSFHPSRASIGTFSRSQNEKAVIVPVIMAIPIATITPPAPTCSARPSLRMVFRRCIK